MRKIAGIELKTTANSVQEVRTKVNEELDKIDNQLAHYMQIDEGFFTNLMAVLDVAGQAGAAAKKAASVAVASAVKAGGEAMVQTQQAFASAQGRARLKAFEKELAKTIKEFERFDTDSDLQAVLKTDPKLARLMKSTSSFMRSMVTQLAAIKLGADSDATQ